MFFLLLNFRNILLIYYFQLKVEATFRRALTGVDQDNVIIEINSLR